MILAFLPDLILIPGGIGTTLGGLAFAAWLGRRLSQSTEAVNWTGAYANLQKAWEGAIKQADISTTEAIAAKQEAAAAKTEAASAKMEAAMANQRATNAEASAATCAASCAQMEKRWAEHTAICLGTRATAGEGSAT